MLELCLDRATETLFDGLHQNVFVESGRRVDETGQELRLRLAGLLPGLARWSHLALNGLPNELVDVGVTFFLEGTDCFNLSPTGPDGCEGGRCAVRRHILKVRGSFLITGRAA